MTGERVPLRWPVLVRRYLAAMDRRKEDVLTQAIEEAASRGLADLVTLLEAFREDDEAMVGRIAKTLEEAFLKEGRRDDATTVALLALDFQVRKILFAPLYPLSEQASALEKGLEACKLARELCRLVADESCMAFYLAVLGEGLAHVGQMRKAVTSLQRAVKIYRQLATAWPEDYAPDLAITLTELGTKLREINRLGEAVTVMQAAVTIQRQLATRQPAVYEPVLANILTRLGVGLQQQGRLAEAEGTYREALVIYQRLVTEVPWRYEPVRAEALAHLGIVLHEQRQLKAAEWHSREALAIYQRWRVDRPGLFDAEVAWSLTTLGIVLGDRGRLEEATAALREALAIRRQLAAAQPQLYEEVLAKALNNLGSILNRQRQWGKAAEALQEAVIIYQRLAEAQPELYELDRAQALSNLGLVLHDQRRLEEAEHVLREALAIQRRLAAKQIEGYAPDLAATLNNLGLTLHTQQQFEEAGATYQEAVVIYRGLVTAQSQAYKPDLARILTNLGDLLRIQHQLEAAEHALREAEGLYRHLAGAEPQAYAPHLAATLNNLGTTLHEQQRFEEAGATYQEAVAIYRGLVTAQSQVYAPALARLLSNLGSLLHAQRRLGEAVAAYQEALVIHQRLATTQPEVYEPDLAMTLNNLSTVLWRQQQPKKATTVLQEALTIRRRLAAAQPEIYEPDLAMTLENLAVVLRTRQRLEAAVRTRQEALAIRRRLAVARPEIYEPDLAKTLHNLGNLLRGQGQPQKAETTYQEAVAIYRRWATVQPEVYGPDLAHTLVGLGIVFFSQQRLEEAEEVYWEAVRLDPHNAIHARWQALRCLSLLKRRQGKRADAIRLLGAALHELEGMRGRLSLQEDRLAFQQDYSHVYGEMVELCLESGQVNRAWHWLERGKGRTLLDRLSSARPRLTRREQEETYATWQQLQQQLFTLEEQLHILGLQEPTQESELRGHLVQVRQEEVRLRHQMLRMLDEGRELIQVSVPQPKPLALSLRHLALPQEADATHRPLLVEYFVPEADRCVVFLLPLWQVTLGHPLPLIVRQVSLPAGTMERMCTGFVNAQEEAHLGFAGRYRGDIAAEASSLTGSEKEHARARALEAFATLPAWLGKTFVQPWLQDKELEQLAPTCLLLVPHGPLHLLPLHAALLDDTTTLIDRYPLVYLANATMARPLAKRRQTRAKPQQRLVMGPPGTDLQGAQIETKELADLWEVSNIGQPYMLERMRVQVLRDQARRLRLVHLATHSTFDFIDYLQSSIRFHNERLTLVNLISDTTLDFHGTRLLYLSSCASGLSRLDQADELQGLVWAFLYAGVEAVMASLWPVDDGAAQYMASTFYDHWQPGTAPMTAYQTALRQLRSEPEYANPYYWAPFVLFGDGFSPLEGR